MRSTRCTCSTCIHVADLQSKHSFEEMARDVKAYLSRKKTEATDLDVAQEWAELEELHSNRYVNE